MRFVVLSPSAIGLVFTLILAVSACAPTAPQEVQQGSARFSKVQ